MRLHVQSTLFYYEEEEVQQEGDTEIGWFDKWCEASPLFIDGKSRCDEGQSVYETDSLDCFILTSPLSHTRLFLSNWRHPCLYAEPVAPSGGKSVVALGCFRCRRFCSWIPTQMLPVSKPTWLDFSLFLLVGGKDGQRSAQSCRRHQIDLGCDSARPDLEPAGLVM